MEGRQDLPNQEISQSDQYDSSSGDPFIGLIRRPKERFYEKKRDLYGRTYCTNNEKGCLLYLTDQFLQNLVVSSYLNSSYVYSAKSKHLVYIIDGQIEDVNIDNFIRLQLNITRMMNTITKKYDYKLLSYKEIYLLITLNGGHKPRDIEGDGIEKLFSELSESGQQNLIESSNNTEDLLLDILLEKGVSKRDIDKFENFFYEKSRNLYGSELLDVNPDETTGLFYLEKEEDTCYRGVSVGDYVFISELLEFYFVHHDRLEHIKINNMENFIIQFYEIMDNDDYRYDHKCVPIQLIQQLILSNQGLIPVDEKNIDSVDRENGFEIRNTPLSSRYSNKESWIRSNQTYYMPGLPICIKSSASSSSQNEFTKCIQSTINTITNEEILITLPKEGSVILFSKEIDAKEYVRAMRGNIYDDSICFQSPIFEIHLLNPTYTSALQTGGIYYRENYDGLKHTMKENIIFFKTDVSNIIPQKVSITIESLKGKIAEWACHIDHDYSNTKQLKN